MKNKILSILFGRKIHTCQETTKNFNDFLKPVDSCVLPSHFEEAGSLILFGCTISCVPISKSEAKFLFNRLLLRLEKQRIKNERR